MELSNYLVSWVVTYLGDLQPTYIRVIIYLLSSMDIPVGLATEGVLFLHFLLDFRASTGDIPPGDGATPHKNMAPKTN